MILYHNSFIKMDYNPATDILYVEYPDLEEFLLSEIKRSVVVLVEAIRNYDVKKLLLDASKTAVKVSESENTEMSMMLASELVKTRLQKVARIQPADPLREAKAQENIDKIQQAGLFRYQLRTFSNKEDAMVWLCGSI